MKPVHCGFQSRKWVRNAWLGAASGLVLATQAQVFNVNPGSVVNAEQAAGTYGIVFTADADAQVTQLGAFDFGVYSSGTANIQLWREGDSSALASSSIDLSGGTDSPATWKFVYAAISPVSLQAGVRYALVWRDNVGQAAQPMTQATALSVVSNPGISITQSFNHTGLGLVGNPLDDSGSLSFSSNSSLQIKGSVDLVIGPAAVPEPAETLAVTAAGLFLFQWIRRARRSTGASEQA